MTHIEELQNVIQRLHGVESTHIESVPVKETFQGKTVWDGVVEVFELIGHSDAQKVYAWSHEKDDGEMRHVTVLHVTPVVSPEDAVRAHIIQEYRLDQEN